MKRIGFPKIVFFTVSPFLCIPGLLYGIYKKQSINLILFAILFGIMSYLYIPKWGNDISGHYLEFKKISKLNFTSFLIYLNFRPDFIFYFLMFSFNKIGLSAQSLWLTISIFNTGTLFYLFHKLIPKSLLNKNLYLLTFLFILASISYPQLFSNVRFYFGASFLVLGFYFGILERRKWLGLTLVVCSVFVHFSTTAFVPIYLLLVLFPEKNNIYKILFFTSFIFLLVPKSTIAILLDQFGISALFPSKVDAYTQEGDLVETGMTESTSGFILYLIKLSWVYLAYVYLAFTIKRKSLFRNMCYGILFIVNVSYSLPFAYYRFSLVLKIFFAFLILNEMIYNNKKQAFYIFFALFIMGNIVDFITMRNNLFASYFNFSSTNILSIILTEITPSDFLGTKGL